MPSWSLVRFRTVVLLAVLLVAPTLGRLAADFVSPAESRLKADVVYLADDAREGRGTGSKGIDEAADYVTTVFKEAGLKPAAGAEGYFQPFSVPGPAQLGEPLELAFQGPGDARFAAAKSDFIALAFGSGGKLEDVPVVFAGYGITAKDEGLKLDYDDYKDLDVKGKAVLILRREPQPDKDDSPFAGRQNTSYAQFRHKVANAASHGAAAVILVNDASSLKGGKDVLLDFYGAGPGRGRIPFLMLKRDFADKLLAAAKQPSLEEFEKQIDADLKPASRVLEGWTVRGEVTIERKTLQAKNVVGVLEGAGPLAEETIVIGAHYDHLGRGTSGGSLAFGSHEIHNGADDNASGTALVLELARRLARRPDPLPRRIVFMTFSGEELGLLGSRYYVEHPLYPLKDTVAMINFDMVGRLNAQGDLTIFGAGTSPGFEDLVKALVSSQGLKSKVVPGTQGEFFQSDHASFYNKNIPVLFAFTGNHADYHRPSDDSERINFRGMSQVADVGELLLLDLARRPERPKFTKLPSRPQRGGRLAGPGGGAYLGSRPAYGEGIEGVKLDGVNDDSPAEKAGLKAGDIVIKFDGKAIRDIDDYMEALSTKKPGDAVEIVVKRDGEEKTLKATLGTRGRD
jgi:hypothetical protein